MKTKLTENQRRILTCIDAYSREHGFAPDAQELRQLCGIGSNTTIVANVEWLVDHGYLSRPTHTYRTMRVLRKAD